MVVQHPTVDNVMLKIVNKINDNVFLTMKRMEKNDSTEISVITNDGIGNKSSSSSSEVSFSPKVSSRKSSIRYYTEEYREKSWYSQRDIHRMKKEYNDDLIYNDDETRLLRVLERKRIRKQARNAVMAEQERFILDNYIERDYSSLSSFSADYDYSDNYDDEEADAIAAQYVIYSKSCALEAHNKALMDQIEAYGRRNSRTTKVKNKKISITTNATEAERKNKKSQHRRQQQGEERSCFIKNLWSFDSSHNYFLACSL